VSVPRHVVVPDLFPPPDSPRIIRHDRSLPLDSPSWNPGSALSIARGARSFSEIRRSSWPTFAACLSITTEPALLVPSRGTLTWPPWERPKQAHPIDDKANPKSNNRPKPQGFGQTSAPLFTPPCTACSKQWHTVSGPAQPSRGARARERMVPS
jgi:hypothetical protein